jgi:hypothetical protein
VAYRKINDSEIDPDSPITTSLMFALRENPSDLFLLNRLQEYDTAGTYAFNIPPDAKVIRVLAVGAGGAGGNGSGFAGGGGGGAFAFSYIVVAEPGVDSLSIEVGAGGAGAGGDTTVSGSRVIIAPGGGAGGSVTSGTGGQTNWTNGFFVGSGQDGSSSQDNAPGGHCPLYQLGVPPIGQGGTPVSGGDGGDGGTGQGGDAGGNQQMSGSGGGGGDGYVLLQY